ncbi:MAG: hypothetical protein L0Y72_16610 [Gemmataceae bacterium]|nr:hypothetical protein [Gemmataceae bacterium]MCI0740672.1 hypothetical protein [Gemmataceae bacterium]
MKVAPRLNQLQDITPSTYDQEYKDFVRRCHWLRNYVRATHRELLSPREIDKLLLNAAETDMDA